MSNRPTTAKCTGNSDELFYTCKCENISFISILSKFSAVTPPRQTFTVNRPWCILQVWKIWSISADEKLIRLKNLEFSRSE